MKQKIEEAKEKINRYYSDFIEKCREVHGIDLTTIISDCVTAGYESRIEEMNVEEFNKRVKNLTEDGYLIIEKLAREVMNKDKRVYSFTMAMGSYFFSDYDGCQIDEEIGRSGEYGAYKYYKKSIFDPLKKFLSEHNETFKFTGIPMHFVRDGEIITDW
ncbi:hypothetical protein ACIXQX_17525 [Bacteroides fragilis]